MSDGNKLATEPRVHGGENLPKLLQKGDFEVAIEVTDEAMIQRLFGVKEVKTAKGLMTSALTAMGGAVGDYHDLALSMAVEMQPRDAVEAMLILQMTATHTAMTSMSGRMLDTPDIIVRDKYNVMMTRLSRTFCVQMDALKKYRAKASQTVRVERVEVLSGGQAIVGDVTHTGGQSKK